MPGAIHFIRAQKKCSLDVLELYHRHTSMGIVAKRDMINWTYMKRTFLAKLQTNGVYYLISALIVLIGAPLYQFLILIPQGYNDALAATSKGHFSSYLTWISNHIGQFLVYRVLLIIAFALLISLPFTLFRIIVAQEVLGRDEAEGESEGEEEPESEDKEETDGMPAFSWRGKGYAVLAAWSGLFGILLYLLGTLASTTYLSIVARTLANTTTIPDNFPALSATFSIITNTVGGGLLTLACLFFGATIARSGRNLWPGIWVAFGYMALALTALLSGSAVAVALAPTEGQSVLTTPAILLFAIWVLWFGLMLVRLKPEE